MYMYFQKITTFTIHTNKKNFNLKHLAISLGSSSQKMKALFKKIGGKIVTKSTIGFKYFQIIVP